MRVYLVAQAWFSQLVRHENILGLGGDEMRMYLAGGIGGNLKPMWNRAAARISAGQEFEPATNAAMLEYSGGESRPEWREATQTYRPYILESFYYVDKETEILLPHFGDFLLDSGAFTFMENAKTHVDWEEYLERYADFIRRNNIGKFFELDIDSLVGYEKVVEYRKKLERLTGKQPIPVWHSPRGKEEFLRHCDEYPYVSLGGIVGKEWKLDAEKYMPWFISEAHRRGVKIHGLGYTKLEKLKKFHFDSVDSTSWTTGNRFGFVYKFNGRTMIKVDVPKGKRIADPRKVALINYTEWVKFQQWADTHL